jgi:hypothetical protein
MFMAMDDGGPDARRLAAARGDDPSEKGGKQDSEQLKAKYREVRHFLFVPPPKKNKNQTKQNISKQSKNTNFVVVIVVPL